jgi:hypothetical protein
MCCLEFSLKILVVLECFPHFVITKELIWNLKWHQELGSVCSSRQLRELCDDPEEEMLNCLLFSMDNISLKVWVEITWVSKNLEEATDSLLCLILGFSLDIN